MRKLIVVVALLSLSGCHRHMTPEAVAETLSKCKRLGLEPQTFVYAWDGLIAQVQCVPK